MNQTNNRIREEWENKLRNKWETFSVVNDYYENADIRLNSDRIADFFILEISELLKSQEHKFLNQPANAHDQEVRRVFREELVGKICDINTEDFNTREEMLKQVINIIKE